MAGNEAAATPQWLLAVTASEALEVLNDIETNIHKYQWNFQL